MKQKTLLDVLAEDSGSIEGVLKALHQLRLELDEGATEDWENPTLVQFLDAMHAWLEAMGPRIEGRLTWKFLESMLLAAKVYE